MTSSLHLDHWLAQRDLPEPFSGVIAFSRGAEQQTWATGEAIKALNLPNTPATRFQMASGCKIFTAVAVCQLMQRGALTPHTRLTDVLDTDFPLFDPAVQVHHLLTHTSGVPDYFDEAVMQDYAEVWASQPMYAVRQARDFLPLFQNRPMTFSPGERFAYNNSGFILLGLIVEALTGQAFTEYVQRQVLTPAGMDDSGYFAADQLPASTAYAYLRKADGAWGTNVFSVPVIGGPDGGAYTTARDMQKFWTALHQGQLLDATALLTPRVRTGWKPPHTHYGYGVWIHDAPPRRQCFVEGADPGVSFRSWWDPQQELTLTVLGNAGNAMWSFVDDLTRTLTP
ncbi:beta-lactamase family protein (plasmid) [Deinococcus taeanensis]|uniref:serine hydrolase domain-containing protein n=1 Tax=Deinococcus taeanensis TaxID=2737050 RepID=UPI001CDBDE88|nr:serine hydrolase domain-containing protein [Deinococcus taeanensis]UBV44626.1 beta-lactamase family protein [Deinococcus taeanensis]